MFQGIDYYKPYLFMIILAKILLLQVFCNLIISKPLFCPECHSQHPPKICKKSNYDLNILITQ